MPHSQKIQTRYKGWLILLGSLILGGVKPVTAWSQPASTPGLTLADVVQLTLDRNHAVRIQAEQMRISEGNLLTASGAFDPFWDASFTQGRQDTPVLNNGISRNGIGTYRIGLNKQYRSGVSLSPGVALQRTSYFSTNLATIYETRGSLLLRMPLMRGRGSPLATATESAARTSTMVESLRLQHAVSKSILQAALAYWNYVAADKMLQILEDAEERARILLQETETLVIGGERAASELAQLQASLADKISTRINAEQRFFEARQNLGLIIGLPYEQFETIPAPREDFPPLIASAALVPDLERANRHALMQRTDLRSSQEAEIAAHTLLQAYQRETRPRLDFQIDVGYSGLSQGGGLAEYLPLLGSDDLSGASAIFSIGYSLPIGNNQAQGLALQQEAVYRQSRIATDDLLIQVQSGVAVVTAALTRSIQEVGRAAEAVTLYKTAVEHERKKLLLGMSTLFDITILEDRLTNALLNEVATRSRYSQALVRLRYETGTLVTKGLNDALQVQDLNFLPVLDSHR
jgi:outer membrane protein TolC